MFFTVVETYFGKFWVLHHTGLCPTSRWVFRVTDRSIANHVAVIYGWYGASEI